jgi:hypothetical protein
LATIQVFTFLDSFLHPGLEGCVVIKVAATFLTIHYLDLSPFPLKIERLKLHPGYGVLPFDTKRQDQ